MSKQRFENPSTDPANQGSPEYRWTRRGKIVKTLAGVALAVATIAGFSSLDSAPKTEGKQIAVVQEGDGLQEIINVNVENGASFTGDVEVVVRNNPNNADVFENGQLDPGEKIELPESVGR